VLYVAEAGPEYRALRGFLARQPEFQLDARVGEAPKDLSGYDLIIAGVPLDLTGFQGRVIWLAVPGPSCPVKLKAVDETVVASKLHTHWAIESVPGGAKVDGIVVVCGKFTYVGAEDTWRLRGETGDEPEYGPFWRSILK
jgi:hypothetical protein